jgi:hypothetical protein
MNSRQHAALRFGLGLILLMWQNPPWRGSVVLNDSLHDAKVGYNFLFSPPEEGARESGTKATPSGGSIINLPQLTTQWVVVVSVTALAVLPLRDRAVATREPA